mmetsp:Transcript_59242/g.98110  ORF Transcript_59242/g.98110 Transcript_59242/m.98110 type:complete len:232 (+) Transcript_59242:489-1184(+)
MAEKQHAPSVMKRYISPAVQEQVCAGTFRLCPSSLVPVKLLILCMVLPFVTSVKSSRSFVLNRSTTSAANKAPVVSVLQKPKPRARDTSYDKTSTLSSLSGISVVKSPSLSSTIANTNPQTAQPSTFARNVPNGKSRSFMLHALKRDNHHRRSTPKGTVSNPMHSWCRVVLSLVNPKNLPGRSNATPCRSELRSSTAMAEHRSDRMCAWQKIATARARELMRETSASLEFK